MLRRWSITIITAHSILTATGSTTAHTAGCGGLPWPGSMLAGGRTARAGAGFTVMSAGIGTHTIAGAGRRSITGAGIAPLFTAGTGCPATSGARHGSCGAPTTITPDGRRCRRGPTTFTASGTHGEVLTSGSASVLGLGTAGSPTAIMLICAIAGSTATACRIIGWRLCTTRQLSLTITSPKTTPQSSTPAFHRP